MFKKDKIKQFIEHLEGGLKSGYFQKEACNDPDERALLETSERLYKDARDKKNNAPSEDFREKLYARLSAAKEKTMEEQQTGWGNKIYNWIDEKMPVLTSPRGVVPALALVVVLVFGAYLGLQLYQPRIAPGSIKLSLEAKNGDLNGIGKQSGFVLRSNQSLSAATIKKYIKFDPDVDYSVKKNWLNVFSLAKSALAQSRSGEGSLTHEYEIAPKEVLAEGAVYKIAVATSSVDLFDHDYSWAFQVKKDFDIEESMPTDKATRVPINTGIEITFNRLDIATDAENFFEIQPAVPGKFEIGVDKITFIPAKDLAEKTVYKVTIKKGYTSGEKGEVLADDKTFSFETAAADTYTETPYLNWNRDYTEMTPDKPGMLEASGNATSSNAIVYQYQGSANFLSDYNRYEGRYNSWSTYNQEQFQPSGAQEFFSFKPELLKRDEGSMFGLIKLPRNLPAGLYTVKLITGPYSEYAFIRVSPLAFYYTEINGDGLIWAYDFINKKSYTGVEATFIQKDGSRKNLGATDQNGLLKFDSSVPGLKDDAEFQKQKENIALLFSGAGLGETAVPDIGNMLDKKTNYYQGYLNTDRYAYRLTDKVHFWGVVKGRNLDLREKKIKVSLDGLVETEAIVSPFDTISGELNFQGLPSGYHNLTATYNDETVAQAGIEVFVFEKPIYKIQVTPDKVFSQTGQPVKAKVKVDFFDGTPVANMDLKYTVSWKDSQDGTLKTDANGQAEINYTPEYYFNETSDQYSESWTTYPMGLSFTVRPALGEEGEIWGEAYVNIYGPKLALDSEEKENGNNIDFKAKLNNLDLNASSEDQIIGAPAAGHPVKIKIIRYYYEKVFTGEIYDPVEKIKVKQYSYETRKETVKEADGTTDQKGEWIFSINRNVAKGNGYLKAIFSAQDDTGKKVMSSAVSYDYFSGDNSYLSLKNLDQKNYEAVQYKVGEDVHLKAILTGSNQPIDGRTLFFRFQDGLRGAQLVAGDAYSDNFSDQSIPSMSYRAVKIMPDGFMESDIVTASFDAQEKKLGVDIQADKEKYRPRDTINLNVSIKDKNNQGVKAVANVSAVDEALLNIAPGSFGGDILENLYADIMAWPNSLSTRYVKTFPAGAEKGGCFLGGTKIKMGDGTEKNIEDIRVGDEILTFQDSGAKKLAKTIVQGISSHDVLGYLVIDNKLKLTPEHKIYLNGKWGYAGRARTGDVLTDEKGQSVVIKDVKYVAAQKIKVYNIVVSRYHTYFADGIYVHNAEKGGGGDIRNYFEDTPLYQEYQTDGQGNIKTSFTAPDNLTSWHVKVNAYSPEGMLAGSGEKLIPVGLPLFADAVVSQRYLTGDSPIIKIRAFGSQLKSDQPVEYSVAGADLNLNYKSNGGPELYLPLGALSKGKHKIVITVRQGGLSDSLEKNFEVFDNYVTHLKADSRRIGDGPAGLSRNPGFTDIMFTDEGKGKYFNSLAELYWSGSLRSDIQTASYLAGKTLDDNFYGGQSFFNNDLNLNEYLNNSDTYGIFSLFPYSAPNYSLTALVADAAQEKFDNQTTREALERVINEKSAGQVQVSQVLYGLASLGSPNLALTNYLLQNASTTPESKIYLALALYKAGDKERARQVYFDDLQPLLKFSGDGAYLEFGKVQTKNIKATAAFGVLASYIEGVGADTVNKVMAYLKNSPPKNDSIALEQAMILKNEIAKTDRTDASFSFATNKRREKVDLTKGQTYRLTISADELKTLAFSDVKGNISAISYLDESARPADLRKSNLVSIARNYFIDGKEASEFKEGDLVEIRLDPQFAKNAPDDNYQVSDYLPSGLVPITREYNAGDQPMTGCDITWYPAKVTETAVYFNVGSWFKSAYGCPNPTISYHARVAGKGKFRAQGALIQSLNNLEIENASGESSLEVK